MRFIKSTAMITETNNEKFAESVSKIIREFQGEGKKVEVQFSAQPYDNKIAFFAFIIGR